MNMFLAPLLVTAQQAAQKMNQQRSAAPQGGQSFLSAAAQRQDALRQVQQSGVFRAQSPNNFGFQQQPAQPAPQSGAMQAAQQSAFIRRSKFSNVGR